MISIGALKTMKDSNTGLWLCMAVAFLIPFDTIVFNNVSLVLWVGYGLLVSSKSIFKLDKTTWFIVLPVLLFSMNLFSLFSCGDIKCKSISFSFLERHMLFAAFPLLYVASPAYGKEDVKIILEAFVWGNAMQIVIFLLPFFSLVHHPYLGMFSVFSFSYCLATYIQEKKMKHFLLSALLMILIIVIKAKLAFGLACIITLVIFFRYGRLRLFYLSIILAAFGSSIIWFFFKSFIQNMFIIKTYSWKCALEAYLGSQKYIFGVGIGDSEKMLLNVYQQYPDWIGYMGYNAHNQFIEIILAYGILGLIILTTWLLYGFIVSIRNENEWLYYFVIILFFSFQTESMLWRQKGILFTVFFFVVLLKEFEAESKSGYSEKSLGF